MIEPFLDEAQVAGLICRIERVDAAQPVVEE
jgi:hypothetical protein